LPFSWEAADADGLTFRALDLTAGMPGNLPLRAVIMLK